MGVGRGGSKNRKAGKPLSDRSTFCWTLKLDSAPDPLAEGIDFFCSIKNVEKNWKILPKKFSKTFPKICFEVFGRKKNKRTFGRFLWSARGIWCWTRRIECSVIISKAIFGKFRTYDRFFLFFPNFYLNFFVFFSNFRFFRFSSFSCFFPIFY